jgi:hypothetical protein
MILFSVDGGHSVHGYLFELIFIFKIQKRSECAYYITIKYDHFDALKLLYRVERKDLVSYFKSTKTEPFTKFLSQFNVRFCW